MSDDAYNRFYSTFQKNKDELRRIGVKSLSGYVAYMMEERMKKDVAFSKHTPKIKCLAIEPNCAILRDNISGKIIEVGVQKGDLACQHCGKDDCIHVGFVLSMPSIYDLLAPK